MRVTAEQEQKGPWILKVRHACKDLKGRGGGGSRDASPGRADTGAGVTVEGCQARGDLDEFPRALSWLGTTGSNSQDTSKDSCHGCTPRSQPGNIPVTCSQTGSSSVRQLPSQNGWRISGKMRKRHRHCEVHEERTAEQRVFWNHPWSFPHRSTACGAHRPPAKYVQWSFPIPGVQTGSQPAGVVPSKAAG